MRPTLLADDARHPHAVHAGFGGPAASRLRAVLAATRRADLGHLLRLRADGERAAARRRGADRQREVRVQDRATGRTRAGGSRSGIAVRLAHHDQRRSGAAHPALHRLRNMRVPPTSDDANSSRFSRQPPRLPDGTDDVVVVVVNLDPHSTRARTRAARHGRARASSRATPSRRTTCVTDERCDVAARRLRPARARRSNPCTSIAVTEALVTRDPAACGHSTAGARRQPSRGLRRRPRVVPHRGVLRGAWCARSPTAPARAAATSRGLDRPARLPAVARRRLPVAAAVLRRARCATAATTSPTTPGRCPSSAPWPSSRELISRRTRAACGSSSTSS